MVHVIDSLMQGTVRFIGAKDECLIPQSIHSVHTASWTTNEKECQQPYPSPWKWLSEYSNDTKC